MRFRISSLLMVAAILSLLASVVARHLVTQPVVSQVQEPVPPTPVPKLNVVVATREIGYLSEIKADAIKLHSISEEDLPGAYGIFVSTLEDVVGHMAMNPIHSGSLIQRTDLRNKEAGGPLALELRSNQRAITIRVDDVKGVAGFLARGNLVDLISTVPDRNNEAAAVNYVAQNVRVLAIDQDMEANRGEAHVVKAVTLEVSPAIAEAIARAELMGSLKLTLRNPHDHEVSLNVGQKTLDASVPRKPLSLLHGRETGSIKTFDCEALKPCPMSRGD